MSELKDYDIMDIEAMDDERLEKSESGKIQATRVYIKSEADKVIEAKDKEIAELKKQVHYYAQGLYVIQARAEKELRYHKYRLCLAMAEICRHEWCTLYYERKKYSENKFLDHLMSKKNRHKEKWLELAEKFKPNKE